ncbi:hypothetical protein Tco_0983310, partial [Tanacetum coccineum]
MRGGSSFVLDNVRYVSELRRNLISLGTLEKEGFTMKMQSVKIKVIKGSMVELSGTKRANYVYTLKGHAVTRKTLKGKKQLGEYETGWKIKKGNSGLSKVFRAKDTTMSTYLVNRSPSLAIGFKTLVLDDVTSKVVLYVNMGFNESGEYKKTFIGSGVGTSLVQVLQGVEFEVEPHEDHTFEVEPHGNVDHVAGSQEVQTQDLIYYHLARDKEQHSTHKLFSYREDNNEVAFVVAAVEKIYAHESLTFNNTVACEDEIWATKGLLDKAKGNVLGMEIVRDQSGDCDMEKNGKLSCIYAVSSQEYQMVCTRLDIAYSNVGMLDKFDRRLQTDVQLRSYDAAHDGFVNNGSGIYDTYRGCKGGYLAKGTRNRVRIRAKDSSGYCYRCIVKGYP